MTTNEKLNYQILSFIEDDIPEAMNLKNALGWNQTVADWKRFLYLAGESCFKVVIDRHLAATCFLFIRDHIAWLAMLIVKEGYKRRGIGRALMEKSLEYCKDRGITLIKLDGTQEAYPLYRGFGVSRTAMIERLLLDYPAAAQLFEMTGFTCVRRLILWEERWS